VHSAAGVTAVVKDGVLYAFDEVGHPYALDPDSLSTMQQLDPRGAEAASVQGPHQDRRSDKRLGVGGH
jgi:carotenoid cleavage dioxygenase-like enzyme